MAMQGTTLRKGVLRRSMVVERWSSKQITNKFRKSIKRQKDGLQSAVKYVSFLITARCGCFCSFAP